MPTLQEQVNSASAGAIIQHDTEYVGNLVIDKSLTIQGSGIIRTPNADPAVLIPPKTGPVVLRGLEITSDPTWPQVHDLIRFGDDKTTNLADVPQGLTIENCDIHGQPGQDSQRGISANGANLKIIKSKVREIHGKGYDTQAVCCWNGPGPFLFEDSYFEAAGENVMFGGALASIQNLVPTGITIRRCVFFKPPTWRGVWTVKNLFELKNARNVIVDGCVFDGNWEDAQAGVAIQFTPRPSDSGSWAVVEDVQFINNIVRNTGRGVNILGADESNGGTVSTDTRLRRVRIANCLFDVDGAKFGSDGVFLVVTNKTEDVTVENCTVIHTGNIISTDYAPNTRFTYRNNISRHNSYGIFGSGSGIGNPSIAQYFPGSSITGNVIAKEVGGPSNAASLYPAGNQFPETLNDIGFLDLAAGDYRLSSTSAYKGKGTNGLDPGCDVNILNAALAGTTTPPPIPTPDPLPTDPTPTTPTPEPTKTPSPDGTKAPPAASIVDSDGVTWTIGPSLLILQNGVYKGGAGSALKYWNKTVYALGTDNSWWQWVGGDWKPIGASEPGVVVPPPVVQPPPPAPEPAPARSVRWPTSLNDQMTLIQSQGKESYRPSGRVVPRPANMPKGQYVEFIKF